MRVLAVNWRDIKNPDAGGAEVHLHEILSHLVRWGHGATLLAAGWPGCAGEETVDGIRIIRRGHWYDANFVLPLFAQRHLRHETYDVVLEDINKLPFFMPLITRIPVVPVIPHLFGTTVFQETNVWIGAYVFVMERFIPLVFRKNRFMVISPSTKEDIIARGVGPERVEVVLCGLDHGRYRDLGLERFTEPTIVHLGRLRRYKSVEVALRSMLIIREELPAAKLAIIGDGPHRRVLESEASRLGLAGSVQFLGFMSSEALVEYLNRAHLLVNPSPKEGWGLTVVEANACGLPVVASDRPGLRDSVRDGETGFLFAYGDERALAAQSLMILKDSELWRRLSEGALERVKELTWERCAREALAMLERVVSGSGGDST